jgi:hypothetical protein
MGNNETPQGQVKEKRASDFPQPSAIARPMPPLAPVTRMVFDFRVIFTDKHLNFKTGRG